MNRKDTEKLIGVISFGSFIISVILYIMNFISFKILLLIMAIIIFIILVLTREIIFFKNKRFNKNPGIYKIQYIGLFIAFILILILFLLL